MNLRARAALGRAVLRYRFLGIRTPIAIAWLVTGRCTACRSYCRWKSERDTNELGTTAALELIEEMAEAGVLMISFTGGEPLLRDDIGLLIHRVKSKGIVCKLNTNGDLVLRRIDSLRSLDLLQISLDGPAKLHDPLRGRGSADRASNAVRRAHQEGIPVQVITCLTRYNLDRLDEVLAYAKALDVRLHVQPLA
ncbi:MAG TPA: radical SAM protein [Polyangiaceae bacterium]|nr:MAG: pyrroloquinoline quinone biosynthesis protein PqqE [Deltaproteobacteria bacterium ADurb.Bin207]HNS97018.1 radical SAM protein [Polyangiaceae bacterium]HNZ23365.1 radical SAM protein [Polyangiaceae bacterium]HOD25139.1 radical SAM protein [Polyangiaceae bacterium]HOE50187.1 radical SAM protein [Polyangiaceae bacterium]